MSQGEVRAVFDLTSPETGPFPSDRFTVPDPAQRTGLRVNLPTPDCSVRVSDCEDLLTLNALDGFNLQPRLTISFDGAIAPDSVSSESVALIEVPVAGSPRRIGINQAVWDTESHRISAQSDELLAEHTLYGLIVLDELRDPSGERVRASEAFQGFVTGSSPVSSPYRERLEAVLHAANTLGLGNGHILTASAFTTMSATAVMEKMRDQVLASPLTPASFLQSDGSRSVFARGDVASITHRRQTRTLPAFANLPLPMSLLEEFGPTVGTLAFGTYSSKSYLSSDNVIPEIPTGTGSPVGAPITLAFNLFLPAGTRPASGWPVVLFGHGGQSSKELIYNVAGKMAEHGYATASITIPGHGFGPLSSILVNLSNGQTVTVPAPGRGIDLNGDTVIRPNEGLLAPAPYIILRTRDTLRQATVDLMYLVHAIQAGMDVDGDGVSDIDAGRIHYFGNSLGGNYGVNLLALDPAVRVGDVTHSSAMRSESQRLSTIGRPNEGGLMDDRIPSLLNSAYGLTEVDGVSVLPPYYNENLPARDEPVRVNTVPGALEIQQFFDYGMWAQMSGNPYAYGPLLSRRPLAGMPAKRVMFQMAEGDRNVPNPTTSMTVRAAGLERFTSFLKTSVVYAQTGFPALVSPHPTMLALEVPDFNATARRLQEQIAHFFDSGGTDLLHPEPVDWFEVPVNGLPEYPNYFQ